ncbi:MAG: DUF2029 domain-containing protein [Anaerolineae bacterium]|nr:DUF2029 domain-containing protein [Anaerolineae bacterium]
MKKQRYEWRILGTFVVLLAAYLALAWLVLAPQGYYGTSEAPRFADPWIERAETLLKGGKLYTDVFTTTPPLVNFLMVPPALVARMTNYQNPGTTTAFMVYFSLFNLIIAYLLYFSAQNRALGSRWAMIFLLNPLTMGNSVLRRQDESLIVVFFALALLFYAKKRHALSSIVMGLSLLVKLTGGMMIPVAFLNTWNWRYLIIPVIVFGLIFAPFYLQAGEAAVFWDTSQEQTEHPFQFGGISFGALWIKWQMGKFADPILTLYSIGFVAGVLLLLGYIAWKPAGLLPDLALLITGVLLLSAKLHCGYFLFLVFTLAPLVTEDRLLQIGYIGFSLLALFADMFKWPIENFPVAMILMIGVHGLLVATTLTARRQDKTSARGCLRTAASRRPISGS